VKQGKAVRGSIILPEWDEIEMRPKTKMPNCPNCEEDELGMLKKDEAFCYQCLSIFVRDQLISTSPSSSLPGWLM